MWLGVMTAPGAACPYLCTVKDGRCSSKPWHVQFREPLVALTCEVCTRQTVCESAWGRGCEYRLPFIKRPLLARQDAKCFAQIISFNKCDSV